MAAFLANAVYDAALNYLRTNTTHLYSTDNTAAPDNYTKASDTYKCGTKTLDSDDWNAVEDHTTGRKIVLKAITDGTVNETETAKFFALTTADALLAYQELDSTQGVTSGNTFTLTAVTFAIPAPTA